MWKVVDMQLGGMSGRTICEVRTTDLFPIILLLLLVDDFIGDRLPPKFSMLVLT